MLVGFIVLGFQIIYKAYPRTNLRKINSLIDKTVA
jgi:hypothetical protein